MDTVVRGLPDGGIASLASQHAELGARLATLRQEIAVATSAADLQARLDDFDAQVNAGDRPDCPNQQTMGRGTAHRRMRKGAGWLARTAVQCGGARRAPDCTACLHDTPVRQINAHQASLGPPGKLTVLCTASCLRLDPRPCRRLRQRGLGGAAGRARGGGGGRIGIATRRHGGRAAGRLCRAPGLAAAGAPLPPDPARPLAEPCRSGAGVKPPLNGIVASLFSAATQHAADMQRDTIQ